jgi:hypothetical protein
MLCIISSIGSTHAQIKYDFEPIVDKSYGERRIYFLNAYPSIIETDDSTHHAKSKEFIHQYKAFARKVDIKDIMCSILFLKVKNCNKMCCVQFKIKIKKICSFIYSLYLCTPLLKGKDL